MSRMTYADGRSAARAIRAAEHGREAIRVVRPRSVLGIVRSRGPLSIILLVADAEARLARSGPGSFAGRPVTKGVRHVAHGRGSSALRS